MVDHHKVGIEALVEGQRRGRAMVLVMRTFLLPFLSPFVLTAGRQAGVGLGILGFRLYTHLYPSVASRLECKRPT